MICELLEVEGAQNIRDLGGYPGADGRLTRSRRLIRSGSLAGLTRNGRRQIDALGVSRVIDLRSRLEARTFPDALGRDGEIEAFHVPMLDHIQSNFVQGHMTGFPESMLEMYLDLLRDAGEQFGQALRLIAETDKGAVLFHCTAGKDRTGLLSMLLLSNAGVSVDCIVEDYRLSQELLDKTRIVSHPGLPGYLFESHPQTMREVLDRIGREYGGIERYLEKIGIGKSLRGMLREKLLG